MLKSRCIFLQKSLHNRHFCRNFATQKTQKMKIYFVGYMFSGKSSVGKKISRNLGLDFYDLDTLFEERYKISVSDFFSRYDESAFRKLEGGILRSTAQLEDCVISTGGGTPCFGDNMDFILGNGISVYLKSSVGTIMSRKANSKRPRPILVDMTPEDVRTFVERQLAERERFYEKADITVDAENIDIEKLAKLILDRKNTTK